jgi:hypothetical protein
MKVTLDFTKKGIKRGAKKKIRGNNKDTKLKN